MMDKRCDTGRAICPHKPMCMWNCHFTSATLETRKIKPYPVIPDDIEPVSDTWQVIGSVMVGFVLVVLFAICLALFFTGLWVWSLLI